MKREKMGYTSRITHIVPMVLRDHASRRVSILPTFAVLRFSPHLGGYIYQGIKQWLDIVFILKITGGMPQIKILL
ncbi:MAG: hypothetical protein KJ638_13010 [Chloroflexi bacterium]|nr:hypothetical protein [Chloroflexota bacterium]